MRLYLPFSPPGRAATLAATAVGFATSGTSYPGVALAVVVAANAAVQWAHNALPGSAMRRTHAAALAYGSAQVPDGLDWDSLVAEIRREHPKARVEFRATCDPDGHAWYCAGSAATLVHGGVIVVAMCRFQHMPGEYRYAVEHEVAHLTGRRWSGLQALLLALLVVPPLLGYWAGPVATGLLWALPAALVVHLGVLWGLELACDAQAQARVGRDAAVRHWGAWTAYRRAGRWTLWQRIVLTLIGTHPPEWLRLAYAKTARIGEETA